MRNIFLSLLMAILIACTGKETVYEPDAQKSPVIANDISNQKITAFAEDEQGHIWIGTFRGLNKYDGNEYHQYFCTDDSLDLPDNIITDIFRDSENRLWIATVNGICRYTEKDNFHRVPIHFMNQNGQQILETRDGRILLNFYNALGFYNPETDSFDKFIEYNSVHFTLKLFVDAANDLWAVREDALMRYNSTTFELKDSVATDFKVETSYLWKNNELWMGGYGEIALFDTRTCRYLHPPRCITEHPLIRQSTIQKIYALNPNTLLLVTDNYGLFVYNRNEQTLLHQNESGFPFAEAKNRINTLFVDSQRNLWLGTDAQGFSVQYSYRERFNNDSFLSGFFKNNPVLALAEDNERNLWISTVVEGLYVYNLDEKKILRIDTSVLLPKNNSGRDEKTEISSLFVDDEGRIWLASKSSNRVVCSRLIDGKLKLLASYAVEGPSVFTQDDEGTIWLSATSEYVYSLKKGDADFEALQVFPRFFNFVSGFLTLRNGKIMASPFYHRPVTIDPRTRQVEMLPLNETEWEQSILRSVLITNAAFEDSRGEVWIGTTANGLLHYQPETGYIKPVPGAPCTDIVSIEEDALGNLWVGTAYGLGRYERDAGRFTNYFASAGIGGNQFSERASCLLSNGTLVFGGTHGLTFFDPIDVLENRKIPLIFKNLKIHNKLIRPQDEDAAINKHLSYKPDIRLKHYQNGFSISFAALDYSEFKRVNYYYKLEGFDNYWVDAHNNREAYYANLPAGTYTFSVRITSSDQSIAEAQESIKVIVEPKPWLTWWAWCIYILAAGGLIVTLMRGWRRIRREKMLSRQAELEREQEQRINQMNMRFFANVSHEFRTPLTMIAGPVSQLSQSPDIPKKEKDLLCIVQRSVARMLQLVNQMMDFHKLENDTLHLSVKQSNIIEALCRITEVFRINAQSKGVDFRMQGLEDSFVMWMDEDKVDKIAGNLLSNAVKHTPSGGAITVDFDLISRQDAGVHFGLRSDDGATRFAKLTVSDTGKGIPEGKQEEIFKRYYQANDSGGVYNYGTGIGLYYARSLAELHHGYLKAENRTDTHGAVFTLLLPVDETCYADNERDYEKTIKDENYPLMVGDSFATIGETDKTPHQKTVLVVDDDSEVVHYLRVLLSPHYNVVCHFEADSAFRQMLEEAPDVVLSDVVMPGKDGYSLCRDIKNNLQLCHIPVILVTAKGTVEEQVEGLDTGADAYVTKPFEPVYLLALIKSQLRNREKVQLLLSESTKTEKIDKNILSPQDNAFMTELYHLMETELSNAELDITRLTKRMRISRSKFYYKIKGLTGENPAVFFRIYKLNRAAELIKEGRYNVSEIADMTGFATLSHFSTSFKKQFGTSPSKYN